MRVFPWAGFPSSLEGMKKFEYVTLPLLIHNTKAILDQWGDDGWELVTVVPGPNGSQNPIAYMKREKQ